MEEKYSSLHHLYLPINVVAEKRKADTARKRKQTRHVGGSAPCQENSPGEKHAFHNRCKCQARLVEQGHENDKGNALNCEE